MITFEIPAEQRAGIKTPITILTSPEAKPLAFVEAYEVKDNTSNTFKATKSTAQQTG